MTNNFNKESCKKRSVTTTDDEGMTKKEFDAEFKRILDNAVESEREVLKALGRL